MTDAESHGQPLELIRYDAASGGFAVCEPALACLRALKGPVSVVAVCGRARQGKSFILNQLLQVSGGFSIGSTTRPCTKGLWMWSAPQRRVDAAGREYHIVLLDTEGIDAYDQTAQYSTQIFSLAVLLSTLFVYNQMGGIDEAALDRLGLVTEMTQHIRVRANSSACDARELAAFTPSFLWLLRDFYLKLEDEHGHQLTPADYLETALLPLPAAAPATGQGQGQQQGAGPPGAAAGAAVAAKNAIRASIRALFPDRACATLVRPMHDEQALVSLDSIPPAQLRPEFREGVAELITLILQKAQPRALGSLGLLSGPVLAGLACAYVGAINRGAVPTITTAWQGVAEAECRRAADAAQAAYCSAFNEAVAAEEAALDAEHARCLAAAAAVFADAAVGDADIREAHQRRYLEACAARFVQVRGRKLAEAAAHISELLLAGSSAVSSALADAGAPPTQAQAALSQFLERYAASAAGPHKWPKLLEFLRATLPQLVGGLLARQEAQANADVGRLMAELELARKQLSAAHARADKAEAEAAGAAAAAAQLRIELAEQAAEATGHRVDAETKAAQASALAGQLRELQLVSEKRLLAAASEAQAAVRAERLEAEAEVTELSGRLAAEQRHRAELETQVSELEAQLAATSAQLSAALEQQQQHLEKWRQAKAEASSSSRQRDELKAVAAALALGKQAAEQQRDDALAAVRELEEQLADINDEIAAHMREAEQERARSTAVARKAAAAGAGVVGGGAAGDLWDQEPGEAEQLIKAG